MSIERCNGASDKRKSKYSSIGTLYKQKRLPSVFENTSITYFPLGENKFEEMLRQLETAKHFIFMEYFIVGEGLMWGRILEILAKKPHKGIDVRIMYDGTCEFSLLSRDYPKAFESTRDSM